MSLAITPATAGRLVVWSRELTGTTTMLRRTIRADRWYWGTWVALLSLLPPITAAAYRETISDDAAGAEIAAGLAANSTMRAMLGPPYDLLQVGGFTMWRVGGFVALLAATMAALGVIRATRAEEEPGRLELVRAGAVGRHAPLWAALLLAWAACAALGLIVSASMLALGTPAAGSVAMGLGLLLTGATFAGVGACAAQVSASARTARGIALAAVGAAYLARAVADGSATGSPLQRLGWLSPVQWAAYARPYVGERWWVLLLPAVLAAVLTVVAVRLEAGRDHGAGLRAARPGPPVGSERLRSAGALAWLLERGALGWTLGGLGIFALTMGSLSDVFATVADDPDLAERFRRMGAGAQLLQDAFYVAMIGILVVVIALIGLSFVERLRREEATGRAELMLSTSTSRVALLRAFTVPALGVSLGDAVLCGILLATPAAAREGDPGQVLRLAGAAAAQTPAIALVLGLAVAVHGLAPRARLLPWLVAGWSLIVSWVGAVLGFPQWLLDATPFALLPRLPAEPMAWTPVLAESALAVILCALGAWGYARRDVT